MCSDTELECLSIVRRLRFPDPDLGCLGHWTVARLLIHWPGAGALARISIALGIAPWLGFPVPDLEGLGQWTVAWLLLPWHGADALTRSVDDEVSLSLRLLRLSLLVQPDFRYLQTK